MKTQGASGHRSRMFGVGTVLALLMASVVAGLALQAPAEAYPGTVCNLHVSPASGEITSGQTLTLTGSASTTTTWSVTINGVVHHFTGTTFTETYKAPTVAHKTVIGVTVTCTNSSGALTLRFRIVVDPFSLAGNGSGGHLPNTGGPSLWWLLVGIACALSGGFLAWRGRPSTRSSGRHVRAG